MRRTLIIFGALALVACAHVTRDQILSRTLAGLQAADRVFTDRDKALQEAQLVEEKQRQAEIVAAATSEEDGKRQLAAYRASRLAAVAAYVGKRNKVAAAFDAAYLALATASVDLNETSLQQLVHAAAEAVRAMKDLTP